MAALRKHQPGNVWCMTVTKHLGIICLVLLFAGGCGYPDFQPPEGVPDAATMKDVLFEIHLVEGAKSGQSIYGDSIPVDYYYEAVYRKYGLTAASFDSAMTVYSRNPGALDAIFEEVIERLMRLEADAESEAQRIRDPNAEPDEPQIIPSDTLKDVLERASKIFKN
jgi:hypothetical protein